MATYKRYVSDKALEVLARHIQSEIQKFAPAVNAVVINGRVMLEGAVQDLAMAAKAGDVLKAYMPDPDYPSGDTLGF